VCRRVSRQVALVGRGDLDPVEIVFTDALQTEGLMDAVLARVDGLVPLDEDDERRPILLAISRQRGRR
jgi:hypothetical protein